MGYRTFDTRLALPAVALASLACLQPGIDPVFLALVSRAHGISFGFHGWIVSATQSGMALGSLAAWAFAARLPQRFAVAAAIMALAAGAATASVGNPGALAAIRFAYGLAMGVVYTQAMAHAAANRPSGAYGAVFLLQLVISAAVAPLLPAVADAADGHLALAVLCLVPLAALALALRFPVPVAARPVAVLREHGRRATASAWLLAGATFLFVAATMMVWSFVGGLAISAHIAQDVLGRSVAIGSIAGALTAMAVIRERPLVPPVVSGALCGLTLLAPIAATASAGHDLAFLISVILFNIGSTAIIVRASGLASAASADALFRRFVSCTHCLGMIAGPVAGSAAMMALGQDALIFAASVPVVGGCLALLLGARRRQAETPVLPTLAKLRLAACEHVPLPLAPHSRCDCEEAERRREQA